MENSAGKDEPKSPYNEIKADIPAWMIEASAAMAEEQEEDEGIVE